jgi:hypothetical protein
MDRVHVGFNSPTFLSLPPCSPARRPMGPVRKWDILPKNFRLIFFVFHFRTMEIGDYFHTSRRPAGMVPCSSPLPPRHGEETPWCVCIAGGQFGAGRSGRRIPRACLALLPAPGRLSMTNAGRAAPTAIDPSRARRRSECAVHGPVAVKSISRTSSTSPGFLRRRTVGIIGSSQKHFAPGGLIFQGSGSPRFRCIFAPT